MHIETAELIAGMDPSMLRDLFTALSQKMEARADDVYSIDPENNGTLAQPYAELAGLMADAAQVFNTADLGTQLSPHQLDNSDPATVQSATTTATATATATATRWSKY